MDPEKLNELFKNVMDKLIDEASKNVQPDQPDFTPPEIVVDGVRDIVGRMQQIVDMPPFEQYLFAVADHNEGLKMDMKQIIDDEIANF